MHDRDWYGSKSKSNDNYYSENGRNKKINYGSSGRDFKYKPPKSNFQVLSFIFHKILYPISVLILFGVVLMILTQNMIFNK
jgi:hypothetical protein